MTEKTITVINSRGVHARPASMIMQTASKFESSVQLIKDGTAVDAKSIISMLTLEATHGASVMIKADGADADAAVDAIVALFDGKFNEE